MDDDKIGASAGCIKRFYNDPAAIFAASDAELDSILIFQARHLVTLRKPEFQATERQLN